MNLTTLEQSKKLKEWGAPQDTEKYWSCDKAIYADRSFDNSDMFSLTSQVDEHSIGFAAYDLESLIAWLPQSHKVRFSGTLCLQSYPHNKKWRAGYSNGDTWQLWRDAETPLAAAFELGRTIHEKQ